MQLTVKRDMHLDGIFGGRFGESSHRSPPQKADKLSPVWAKDLFRLAKQITMDEVALYPPGILSQWLLPCHLISSQPMRSRVEFPSDIGFFISYSHDDSPKVAKLEEILRENGLCPMRDQNFALGCGFHEQIKTFIAHAHVFLPVITAASSRRGWVHQEIGYAMAQNVAVLPVTVGTLPGEMLQTLHSVTIGESDEELGGLQQVLTFDVFDNLVNRYRDSRYASYRTAEFTEDRAIMFAEYANAVLNLRQTGGYGRRGPSVRFTFQATSSRMRFGANGTGNSRRVGFTAACCAKNDWH